VLGGGANAVSIVRSLGRNGIRAYVINHPGEAVVSSRYAREIEIPASHATPEESWAAFLLGEASDHLAGSVLIAASDEGLMTLIRHYPALSKKFLLDACNPQAQQWMLSKVTTYQKAVEAGVPTPRFWVTESLEQIRSLKDELVFPLIVKPVFSHLFERKFGKKHVVIKKYEELLEACASTHEAGIETLLVELIPGGDDLLCSYYTYLDEQGNALFDFTKRLLRRYPVGMGGGTYHITDWIPDVRYESLKLFRHVGLRGLANAEFKRDPRDGQLKLIECNARFTAANCLVAASGLDLALLVYQRLTDGPLPPLEEYRRGMRLWYPLRDFHAFRQLRKRGEITLKDWVSSVSHPYILPYWAWDDPLPSWVLGSREITGFLKRRWAKTSSLLRR
jgi:predicted ATP-grasp superfamily ATP-dependent carboligase